MGSNDVVMCMVDIMIVLPSVFITDWHCYVVYGCVCANERYHGPHFLCRGALKAKRLLLIHVHFQFRDMIQRCGIPRITEQGRVFFFTLEAVECIVGEHEETALPSLAAKGFFGVFHFQVAGHL